MALTPEELGRFTVSIMVGGATVETATFTTVEDAECFLEQRTDDDPAATGIIDDDSIDHSASELVELDTAVPEDHDRTEPG